MLLSCCPVGAALAEPVRCENLYQAPIFKLTAGTQLEVQTQQGSFKTASMPKDWLNSEADLVEPLLKKLLDLNLPNFFNRIQQNGFRQIYRLARPSKVEKFLFLFKRYKPQRSAVLAEVSARNPEIYIYDNFFNFKNIPDFQNYKYTENGTSMQVLFHELIHAFDQANRFSLDRNFLYLSGWEKVFISKGSSIYPMLAIGKVDAKEKKQIEQQIVKLKAQGLHKEASALGMTYSKRYGLPTFYSMTNPTECLAEVTTAVMFDPEAETYMNPKLVAWIRQNILN